MIFSIQRHLEDYIERRQLQDPDQYAVRLANLYDARRTPTNDQEFLVAMRRLRTAFFRANPALQRAEFERSVMANLDHRFGQKKNPVEHFPGGVDRERKRLRGTPRRIAAVLGEFSRAVESRAIDVFWTSRTHGSLRPRPEQVGQALLALFLRGVISNSGSGLLLREVASGVGFVDIAVLFSSIPHLVELKVLRSRFSGVSQIANYMRSEGRREGWLVVFDARPPQKTTDLPTEIAVPEGIVRVKQIVINPTPPSRR